VPFVQAPAFGDETKELEARFHIKQHLRAEKAEKSKTHPKSSAKRKRWAKVEGRDRHIDRGSGFSD
jgi:hypothetical protein